MDEDLGSGKDPLGIKPIDLSCPTSKEKCDEVISSMYLFLDGEMSEGRSVEVRGHIEQCMQCFEAFDFEAELKQMIAKKCCDEPPADLKAKILDQLRAAGLPPQQ